MTPILSIETATDICSVAIHESGQLLSIREVNERGAHSQKIMGLIEEVIIESGVSIRDLKAVAVSEGPGSYTGLRIGVSTAKGICFANDIPLIAINTLEALAFQQVNDSPIIISLMDARRMEVYSQVFGIDGQVVRELKSEILTEDLYSEYLEKGKVSFVGDGVEKSKSIISHPNAIFLENQVSSKSVGEIAWKKYEKGEFVDLAYFVPNYLKEFKALHSKKNPLLS